MFAAATKCLTVTASTTAPGTTHHHCIPLLTLPLLLLLCNCYHHYHCSQLHEVVHRSVDPSKAVIRGRRSDEQSGRMDTAACTALLQLVTRAMDRLFPVATPSSRALQHGANGESPYCYQ
jgi:hypothetical protein